MKIKLLKSGGYGFSPTGVPALIIKEEQVDGEFFINKLIMNDGSNLKPEQAKIMIDNKWAEDVSSDESEDEEENEDLEPEDEDLDIKDSEKSEDSEKEEGEIEDVEAHLKELVKDKEEDEAKQILQDWGKTRLDITVSKSNKVENMIAKLVESVD